MKSMRSLFVLMLVLVLFSGGLAFANPAQSQNIETALKLIRLAQGPKAANDSCKKCDLIGDAWNFLQRTKSPKNPFGGKRSWLLGLLDAEHEKVVKANGGLTCENLWAAACAKPERHDCHRPAN